MHNKPTIINPFHHHYETNTLGRDFIVGDLQGCYSDLMGSLQKLGFDKTKDRLFCCGDLIDRGTESFECANLVYEQWFHTTQGNHEVLMVKSIIHHSQDDHNCWIRNGGLWHLYHEKWQIKDLAKSFSELPIVISIGKDNLRVNIVHAELIKVDILYGNITPVTNDDIDNWNFSDYEIDMMLWGRTLVDIRSPDKPPYKLQKINATQRFQDPDNLSLTYVGHSIVPSQPVQIEQQIYLDTGLVNYYKPENKRKSVCKLTIASPREKLFYIYHPEWKILTKLPFDKIDDYT